MHKVIAIVGPTASGKSALAIETAKRLNGEIISADSMQVYRHMDIGTAKIHPDETEGIPHYLIDILNLDEPWNVSTFQKLCREKIEDITARGKVPILCGGTGLYVKAAVYDYCFDDEAGERNEKLQAQLEEKTSWELVALLEEKDPGALEKIHPNNRKRLIRAAVMALAGRSKSERESSQKHEPIYDLFLVGLHGDRQKEIERIDRRVDEMFEQGLEQEVRSLFSSEKSRSYNSFQAIGYKEFLPWLEHPELASLEEIKEKIKVHTRQYARRQMTWFNHQMPVQWFDPQDHALILERLEEWYGRHD